MHAYARAALAAQRDALKAEVARLREALRAIALCTPCDITEKWARAALEKAE